MMKRVKARFFKTRKESQYRPAILRMTIDKRPLIRSEWSVLFQNRIRHANLANVVQERGNLNLIGPILRNIHLARYTQRPLSQPRAVDSCADVFQVEQLVKRANQRVAESEMLLFQFLDPQQQSRTLQQRIVDGRHLVVCALPLAVSSTGSGCRPASPGRYRGGRSPGRGSRCNEHLPGPPERSSSSSCCCFPSSGLQFLRRAAC